MAVFYFIKYCAYLLVLHSWYIIPYTHYFGIYYSKFSLRRIGMLLGKPESILSPNIREHLKGANFVHSNPFGLFLILYYHRVQILIVDNFRNFYVAHNSVLPLYKKKKYMQVFFVYFFNGGGMGCMGMIILIQNYTSIYSSTEAECMLVQSKI